MTDSPVKIATRGSKLALWQANRVKEELEKLFPEKIFMLHVLKTKGDKILDVSLSKIGDKGLFTRELEDSLLNNEADMAVHSLKDMPTALPAGLVIAGVLKRGEFRDALVSLNGKKLADLDKTDIVATSSLRRKAQISNFNNKPAIVDIRGNVDTRLRKMEEGYCTAMIMAAAGLQRLGFHDKITEILDPSIMVPAVSQGAIAIEIRENDNKITPLISAINDTATFTAVNAERIFLNALEGGCQVPIGCFSETDGKKFKISGLVSNIDGSVMLRDSAEGETEAAGETALLLAKKFLDKGAKKIIEEIRLLNKQ
jgi:hydroxymethylbilane synthase